MKRPPREITDYANWTLEQVKDELRTKQVYLDYYEKFDPNSIEEFIDNYAPIKLQMIENQVSYKRGTDYFKVLPQVESVTPIQKKYKLVNRAYQPRDTIVDVCGHKVGGDTFHVVAGPCSVETREQTIETAQAVKKHGGTMFRGGAFKPRTSPYDFQGLGKAGLDLLRAARDATNLPIVTEVMAPHDVDMVGCSRGLLLTLFEASSFVPR